MKEKAFRNKQIFSEDRIKIFILSSLFCALIALAGCGKAVTMHKPESAEMGLESAEMNYKTSTWNGQGNEQTNINSIKTNTEGTGRQSSWNSKDNKETEQENADEERGQESVENGEESQHMVNRIRVHICGEVANPGVYEMEEGSRVIDAVELAGGFTDEACGNEINLAGIIVDSMRIYIPNGQDVEDIRKGMNTGNTYLDQNAAYYASPFATGSYLTADNLSAAKATDMAGNAGKVLININTADENELIKISGIGQTRARSIIEYRQKNGPFNKIEDIQKVSGIGAASFAKMKDMITVD